jgi:hypothetical protein
MVLSNVPGFLVINIEFVFVNRFFQWGKPGILFESKNGKKY